jgi:hypothetical protein
MKSAKLKRQTTQLTGAQTRQMRKDRTLIAKELPDLIAKHQRIREAAAKQTTSGALRRAIHSSKILLHDLAIRAQTDMDTLDKFLTGERPLTSDIIDGLTKILKLRLEERNDLAKARPAKASSRA